jgi:hypothetical protein
MATKSMVAILVPLASNPPPATNMMPQRTTTKVAPNEVKNESLGVTGAVIL